jgi:hypothetical protein
LAIISIKVNFKPIIFIYGILSGIFSLIEKL